MPALIDYGFSIENFGVRPNLGAVFQRPSLAVHIINPWPGMIGSIRATNPLLNSNYLYQMQLAPNGANSPIGISPELASAMGRTIWPELAKMPPKI